MDLVSVIDFSRQQITSVRHESIICTNECSVYCTVDTNDHDSTARDSTREKMATNGEITSPILTAVHITNTVQPAAKSLISRL